jgi:hypothetical protein
MGKGTLKTKAQIEQERKEAARYELGNITFDIEKLLLIYARQSSSKQYVSNIYSAMEQRDGLLEKASRLGWVRDEQRILYIENQLAKKTQVSGALRIDQRPGLAALTEVIESGKASAVLVVSVDRITRDPDLITPIQFANICKDHNVLIITDEYIFDFNNPTRNDLDRFVNEAIAAKEYIRKQIHGKMLKNRDRKAKMGLVANGNAPVGLMLDESALDEKGKPFQLVPSPHAERVDWLYARFRALDASLGALLREVISMGKRGIPLFPDVEGWTPGYMHMRRITGGWTVSTRFGLKYILTNPMYAGHLVWDGVIVKRNAHKPIVDADNWQYAFDHLADVDLDGNAIEHPKRTVRYTQKKSVDSGALLAGVRENGKPVIDGVKGAHVYVHKPDKRYIMRQWAELTPDGYETSISIKDLDSIFESRLLHWLEVSERRGADWITVEERVADRLPVDERVAEILKRAAEEAGVEQPEYDGEEQEPHVLLVSRSVKGKQSPSKAMDAIPKAPQPQSTIQGDLKLTIEELAQVQRALATSADVMSDERLRQTYEKEARLIKRRDELTRLIDESAKLAEKREQAKKDIETAASKWAGWTLEERRSFIHMVTESITLEELAPGWLMLVIVWSPLMGFVDSVVSDYRAAEIGYIWRRSGDPWTDDEIALLRENYPTKPRAELIKLLSTRSWLAIMARAGGLGVARLASADPLPIPKNMSLSDIEVMQQYDLEAVKRVQWIHTHLLVQVTNEEGQSRKTVQTMSMPLYSAGWSPDNR